MSFENRRGSAYFTWRYPNKKAELANDNVFVRGPHRIGNSILIYGRKNTSFPYQAFVRFISPAYPVIENDICRNFCYISLIGRPRLAMHVCYVRLVDRAHGTLHQQHRPLVGAWRGLWSRFFTADDACVLHVNRLQ